MPLTQDEREQLRHGARSLGVELGDRELGRFDVYVDELDRWRERVNLISAGDRRSLVTRHLADSLAAVPLLEGAGRIMDLGSGAGLPGIPIAIALEGRARVILVEPRRRRANFLRAIARALPALEFEVSEAHLEKGKAEGSPSFDALVSRATLPAEKLLAVGAAFLVPGGLVIAYSTEAQETEGQDEAFVPADGRSYRLPGLTRDRRLRAWRRR